MLSKADLSSYYVHPLSSLLHKDRATKCENKSTEQRSSERLHLSPCNGSSNSLPNDTGYLRRTRTCDGVDVRVVGH